MKDKTLEFFSSIADKYDFLNHLLSLGQDFLWRKKLLGEMKITPGYRVLDLCSGTGDLSLLSSRRGGKTVALDLSLPMIKRARGKVKRGLFLVGDAHRLPFRDGSFHIALMGFGLRNLHAPLQSLREIHRVLLPGGRLGILEFSPSPSPIIRPLYFLYLEKLIPWLGKIITGNREAYLYLAHSIREFLTPEEVLTLMKEAGFSSKFKRLTLGIVILYTGKKEEK